MAKRTAKQMIAAIDRYFDSVDNNDVPGTLSVMTPDCTLTVVTDQATYRGRDSGIKRVFTRRLESVDKAWHGNRRYHVDPAAGTATTRFDVRRRGKDGSRKTMDNINFFEFRGTKLRRIYVWMSGTNTLR
ncbi:MAG: nuclear transport factor 2 family protein [Alphaproteobacteria bacterium]|nr:nuclear transport factor 2 family protein [Alphaproteobacteria bacterium]